MKYTVGINIPNHSICFAIVIFFGLNMSTYAQDDKAYFQTKDSISNILVNTSADNKIAPFLDLFNHVFPRELGLVDSIFLELDNLEKTFPNDSQISDIWLAKARVYNYKGNYDSLRIWSQKVLEKDGVDDFQKSGALNNLGIYEERVGSLDSALVYYEQSLKLNDSESYRLYNNLGRLWTRKNRLRKAISYYELAMQEAKKKGLQNAEAVIANNIGTAYERIDNLDKAIEYYKISLEIKEELKDEKGKLYALYNLALVEENIEEARKFSNLGLDIAAKIEDGFFIEAFKMNLGRLLILEGKLDEAERILLPIYEASRAQPYGYNMTIESTLSKLYIAKGEYAKAEKYLNDFYNYAKSINATSEMQNVRNQYLEIFAAQGRYKDYYDVASIYYAIQDSVKSEAALQRFISLEEKLDFEQKEKVDLLNESIAEKEKSRTRLIIIGLLIAGILLLLLYFRNKQLKYQKMLVKQGKENEKIANELNQKLRELDLHKTNFFTNVTHELRTPLSLILGPLEILKENTSDESNLEMIHMIQRNSKRQLTLVNQLLDLSKLDAGKMDIKMSETDLVAFINEVMLSFKNLAESRNITISLDTSYRDALLYFDHDKMAKIFFNLLSNAFKYSSDHGKITLELDKTEQEVVVKIIDEGIGIPEDKIQYIFERFYQVSDDAKGNLESTGVGLALTKELVEMQGGSISVESKEGNGTTIILRFLQGIDHINPDAIVSERASSEMDYGKKYNYLIEPKESSTSDVEISNGKKPSILIVEDNPDVRSFLTKVLQDVYNVSTAIDGQMGKEKALAFLPDLIISDVMMPFKDGYELCQELKQDVNTSHIPVVLLTAKTTHDEKIEGLETGADAYLFKPFDPKEILIRVKNLITSRQLLRSKFATSIAVKPSEITTNSVDKRFLENALEIIEENISDEAFSVEDLANKLTMSKPNLNRKLRALVDQSTNKFIQSIRLQRAKALLQNKAGTVAEIGFQVGFSSSSYFVKCYKDYFKETPGSV